MPFPRVRRADSGFFSRKRAGSCGFGARRLLGVPVLHVVDRRLVVADAPVNARGDDLGWRFGRKLGAPLAIGGPVTVYPRLKPLRLISITVYVVAGSGASALSADAPDRDRARQLARPRVGELRSGGRAGQRRFDGRVARDRQNKRHATDASTARGDDASRLARRVPHLTASEPSSWPGSVVTPDSTSSRLAGKARLARARRASLRALS